MDGEWGGGGSGGGVAEGERGGRDGVVKGEGGRGRRGW